MTEIQNDRLALFLERFLVIEYCNLGFICNLMLVIWNF